MKIALLTNNYKPFVGGVPISIERLKEGLKTLGHEVTVFAPTYGNQEIEEDVFRYRSLSKGISGGVAVPSPVDFRIEKEFQKGSYDIIHVHHPMLIGKTAGYLSKKYRIPLVFTYHTRYEQYMHYFLPEKVLHGKQSKEKVKKWVSRYLQSFFKNCQHIFVPTEGMRQYFADSYLYSGSVSVLPTGLEKNSFHVSRAESESIRKEFGAEEIPLFCTVSRMAPEKNIPFLLHSIKRFREKYSASFKVLFIGEGPSRQEYMELSKELGIEEYVIFTGNIPNHRLSAFYGASDIFLFASKTETQGIVLLESFAAGTPVIAVEASGVSDLVKDGRNGCLVPENMDIFSDRMLLPVTDRLLLEHWRDGALSMAEDFIESKIAFTAVSQYNIVIRNYHTDREEKRREAGKWKISIVS